jgi:hypothetical protein
MEAAVEYTEIALFTSGIKPAYIAELFEVHHLSKKYPSVILDENNHIFFQTEQLKNEFIDRIQTVEKDTPENHRIIGESLCYPPQAVNFFVQCMENPELREKRAHFSYAGMNFAANVQQTLEITYWLWKNVRIPMEKVKVEYLGVEYLISPNT